MKLQSTLLLFLGVLNLALFAKIISSIVYGKREDAQSTSYSYAGLDYPQFVPLSSPMDSVSMTVEESVHYVLGDESTEAPWSTVELPAGGYIHLGPELRLFAIPMIHQLHCIHVLYLGLTGRLPDAAHHSQHCLSYLRQFIVCHPDLTLEPGDFIETNYTSTGEVGRGTNVGITHTCRDWSAVYREIDSSWEQWIVNRTDEDAIAWLVISSKLNYRYHDQG